MARKKVAAPPAATPAPAKATLKGRIGNAVAKGKDFGRSVAERAKAVGTRAKAAGAKAASHVSRNRAAYIAGGLGAAAGTTGIALASRKKRDDG